MMIGIQTYACNKVHKTAFIRKRQQFDYITYITIYFIYSIYIYYITI